jgi:hypothetical protein
MRFLQLSNFPTRPGGISRDRYQFADVMPATR